MGSRRIRFDRLGLGLGGGKEKQAAQGLAERPALSEKGTPLERSRKKKGVNSFW